MTAFADTPDRNASPPARLGAADLDTFNEHLLQISLAGLPIESGLVSLAKDLRPGRLKRAIDGLTADLQAGVPLESAVAGHRGSFPPVYGRLVDAGVQSGDLPGVLFRFGRHAQVVAELRSSLWRAIAYPAVALVALLLLLTFLGYLVMPNYFGMLQAIRTQSFNHTGMWRGVKPRPSADLSAFVWGMLYLGKAAPFLLVGLIFSVAGMSIAYRVRRAQRRERDWVDAVTRLPVIGRALRDSYLASWFDVASIATAAGLDLPRSLRLAAEAVSLPSVTRDSDAIAGRIERGAPTADAPLSRLPATLPVLIDLADGPGHLPQALRAFAAQFEQQARRQIARVPGQLMPPLIVAIGAVAAGILLSLWLPLMQVLGGLTAV